MQTMSVNGVPYTVERLLGRGKGGYSYLVRDAAGEYVLKQIHHEPCDYYQFGDKLASERQDYARLVAAGVPVPKLLAVDEQQERLLKEYVDGPTVAQLVEQNALPDACLAQVRALLKSPAPLADVYKDFSKLETDYMSIVAQCVEDRADDLLKKEQQQNPPKVYRQSVT